MKLNQLQVENFQSLGQIKFDFPKGLVLIDGWNHDLSSHNGVGKSALLNAITYAIYGKLPKQITVGELIRTGTKGMFTDIDLESNGKHIKIIRSRSGKSGKLTLLVDLEEIKGIAKDVEERIPELIGLTFEQFVQVVYVFQGADRRFINLNDTQKKQFLSALLNLEVYDNAYKLAHAKLTQLDLETSRITGSLESSEKNLIIGHQGVEESRQAVEDFKQERVEKTSRISNTVATIKAEIKELEAKQAQAKNSTVLTQLQAKKGEIQVLISKNKENQLSITTIENELKFLNRDLQKAVAARENVKPDTCFECGQDLPGWSHDEHIKKLDKELEDMKADIVGWEHKKSQIKVVSEETLDNMMQKVMDQISEEKAHGPGQYDPLIASQRSELKAMASELENLDQRSDVLKRDLERATRALEVARADIDTLKNKLKESEGGREYLLEIKKIFSPTGVRAYVFDGIIRDLNDRISKYLESLSDGAIHFSFDSDDSKGKFTESCEYMGTKRSIGALSGGEFRRLSLAIDLALADVVCSRISVYPNILFLDEAFEGLDATGREIVMDMLSDMINTKEAIYVVDHATELKTAFSNTFNLVKKNGKTSQDESTQSQ